MFNSVSSKVSSKVSSAISGNRKVLHMFFVILILLEFAPYDALNVFHPDANRHVKRLLSPIVNPVTNLMSNVFMRFVVFVILLWSCCVRKDMNLFFLVALYFVISRR